MTDTPQKLRQKRLLAAGLCVVCGKEPVKPGKKRGEACITRQAVYQKDYQKKYINGKVNNALKAKARELAEQSGPFTTRTVAPILSDAYPFDDPSDEITQTLQRGGSYTI